MSLIELIPSESKAEWRTKEILVLHTCIGLLLIYRNFVHDADTFAPNYKEQDPDLPPYIVPIPHDFLYAHRITATGAPVTRAQADRVYYRWCLYSTNPVRRVVALPRWMILRVVGWAAWNRRERGDPIPEKYHAYYGDNPAAWALRAALPSFALIVNSDGRKRITRLPAAIALA